MRKFVEPTARNLLRRPTVLGVPLPGLMVVATASLSVFVVSGSHLIGNLSSVMTGILGYGLLRLTGRFSKPGWEEALVFALERRLGARGADGSIALSSPDLTVSSPDTLTEADLLALKEEHQEKLLELKSGQRWTLALRVRPDGAHLSEVRIDGRFDLRKSVDLVGLARAIVGGSGKVYSLYRLPVVTDPLWLFGVLAKVPAPAEVFVSFQGMDSAEVKRRIEVARRSNSRGSAALSDIDSEVSFEEASLVLQGLSRGDEGVVEAAVVVASSQPLTLDEGLFCEEKDPVLAVLSVLGIRKRFHRSHLVRLATACDLIPNIADPYEEGPAILRSPRGAPLYFSPQDPRLDALHWVVSGATGSGKSFFTGLILKRMLDQGTPMSVLFIDHQRSFRRLVRKADRPYFEPSTLAEIDRATPELFHTWNQVGTICGIELSGLGLKDRKEAMGSLLAKIEAFLLRRSSAHPLYLVLDECWKTMRDDPVLVETTFREFRKLNGAVIAITQSFHDLATDSIGQVIFQCAPIRVILRQGEDVAQYQGILRLNSVEAARVARLKKVKGTYAECLIKTDFVSRFGRLYPTDEEHELLRTDNLLSELIEETRQASRQKEAVL